jgi:N-acetylglucosaminyldiphosphoundecaprenol N-acetyl-beta-D-mannosaminyltransferase
MRSLPCNPCGRTTGWPPSPGIPRFRGVHERVRIGTLSVDRLTFGQALDEIDRLVGRGGSVFTPNVDHVVQAEENREFRSAYDGASLSLADGVPILWAARLLGCPLPEKVSGSDLVLPLMERAARRRYRVYLLGAGPGVADKAARQFRAMGVNVCGLDGAIVRDPHNGIERAPILERLRAAAPDLVLVALGAPKQELFIHESREYLGRAVAIAVGAALDFVTGTVKRAPRWMSRSGLEWLYRLGCEPRRLWRRYLVRDPKFALVVWRQLIGRRPGLLPQRAP